VLYFVEGCALQAKGSRRWVQWLPGGGWIVLGIWYAAASVGIYPYEIAYFNELFGGPEGGYRYLADSNLDWGQATYVKMDYARANPDVRVDPPASQFRPEPGQYIVGASPLNGLGVADPYAYEWFRHWEPEAVIDYSLLVYEVPPLEVAWVAQCDRPRTPLSETAISEGLGRRPRIAEFDCTRTWVYPGGRAEAGIYALHHDLVDVRVRCLPNHMPCALLLGDSFAARHLAGARVSFEKEFGNRGVPFVLYEMPAAALERVGVACVVRADVPPAVVSASSCRVTPLAMRGPLVYLDAAAYRDGKALDVETWWQVRDGPIARPFSVMGHLLSADGQVVDRSDGLGISPLALVAGDVLVQRHRFAAPPEGEMWLRTGIYWSDTMERWAMSDAPGADALLVRLTD
jgi:hypothetical protein